MNTIFILMTFAKKIVLNLRVLLVNYFILMSLKLIYFEAIFLSFLKFKVKFNGKLWNLHSDLCFAMF